jgi:hypothetical protein
MNPNHRSKESDGAGKWGVPTQKCTVRRVFAQLQENQFVKLGNCLPAQYQPSKSMWVSCSRTTMWASGLRRVAHGFRSARNPLGRVHVQHAHLVHTPSRPAGGVCPTRHLAGWRVATWRFAWIGSAPCHADAAVRPVCRHCRYPLRLLCMGQSMHAPRRELQRRRCAATLHVEGSSAHGTDSFVLPPGERPKGSSSTEH